MKKLFLSLFVILIGNGFQTYSQSLSDDYDRVQKEIDKLPKSDKSQNSSSSSSYIDQQKYYNQMMKKVSDFISETEKNWQRSSQFAMSSRNKDLYVLYINGSKAACFSDDFGCRASTNSIKMRLQNIMESFINGIPKEFRKDLRNSMMTHINSMQYTCRKEPNRNYRESGLSEKNNGYDPAEFQGLQTLGANYQMTSKPTNVSDRQNNSLESLLVGNIGSNDSQKTLSDLAGVDVADVKKEDFDDLNRAFLQWNEGRQSPPSLDELKERKTLEDYKITRSLYGHTDEVIEYDYSAYIQDKYGSMYRPTIEVIEKEPFFSIEKLPLSDESKDKLGKTVDMISAVVEESVINDLQEIAKDLGVDIVIDKIGDIAGAVGTLAKTIKNTLDIGETYKEIVIELLNETMAAVNDVTLYGIDQSQRVEKAHAKTYRQMKELGEDVIGIERSTLEKAFSLSNRIWENYEQRQKNRIESTNRR